MQLTMAELTQLVYRYFSYSILERGWAYFERGAVLEAEYEESGVIYGSVAGTEVYDVEVNLNKLPQSECDCPYDGYCKHMAALIFEVCDKSGLDPYKLLKPGGNAWGQRSVRSTTDAMNALNELMANRGLPLLSAASAKGRTATVSKEEMIPPPSEQGMPIEWQRYFESRYRVERFAKPHDLPKLLPQVTEELHPIAEMWEPAYRLIYEIQVYLFVMRLTDSVQQHHYRYHYSQYYQLMEQYKKIANQCYDEISSRLHEFNGGSSGYVLVLSFAEGTAKSLAAYAFPRESSYMYWSDVYAMIWGLLLTQVQALVDKEIERLHQALEETTGTDSPHYTDRLKLALLFFEMRVQEDQRAMRLIGSMYSKSFGFLFPYLHGMVHSGTWDRLQMWLEWLLPKTRHTGAGVIPVYFSFWEKLMEHRPVESQWRQAVFAALPGSHDYYTTYLMERGQYREWIDMNMAAGYSPLDYRVADFKEIETKQRELLLPWYHLSTEQNIALKNRQAYKTAIRLLRKLRQHYRSLKQTDRWEKYLEHLTQKYARLRAFQEELGKLKKGGES
ncbi:SWIM zinc finger family protein [Paenibacillus sp. GD4]|uniref:SWIM zinc finger family protein n=1 Tax=Paenibacillus sp. GD4 TaxID=3068890 RepID=UPI0027968D28|nr:SWIM zinc finger family protein [Paenibacillus sp. GD4]MDQ1911623.1 SWIM zinc finger family protein [Paenibacillus sp. GD4]